MVGQAEKRALMFYAYVTQESGTDFTVVEEYLRHGMEADEVFYQKLRRLYDDASNSVQEGGMKITMKQAGVLSDALAYADVVMDKLYG